ncbi:hypothetical protein FF38_08484 [Lucilia cuprina]|uniref:Uncharacterized protein n=1 Tax=Lucilia cuprina TaxID=7375 RepID=A0A0L0CDZ1_LUCCU|nr:hypothetical protein FF38_08484 [Lucilia cuprina]
MVVILDSKLSWHLSTQSRLLKAAAVRRIIDAKNIVELKKNNLVSSLERESNNNKKPNKNLKKCSTFNWVDVNNKFQRGGQSHPIIVVSLRLVLIPRHPDGLVGRSNSTLSTSGPTNTSPFHLSITFAFHWGRRFIYRYPTPTSSYEIRGSALRSDLHFIICEIKS